MIRQADPKANEKVKQKVLEILDSGQYVKGPEAAKFEEKFNKISDTKYNYTVNSGTSALNLIFYSLDYPENAEILLPVNSFMASANAIETAGYKPVFVDIDQKYMNIDPDKLEDKITEKTAAILVVHLYGTPAPIDRITEISNKYNLEIIEDAAQAHGAEYKGKKIGSMGLASAFSLFPTKNLSVLGDGGIVCTNNQKIGEKIGALRNAGRTDKADDAEYFGYNMRLSEILAGIGNVLIDDLQMENKKRRQIAGMYDEGLKEVEDISTPEILEDTIPVYHQYTIRTTKRDKLKNYLKKEGIGVSVKYSIPLHLVTSFKKKYNYKHGSYPIAEQNAEELLCLPMHPNLTDNEVKTVIEKITAFFS